VPRFSPFIVGAYLLAMVIAAPPLTGAQEATPETGHSPAPALIEDYVTALNAHEPDRVAALYAEDAVVEQAIQSGGTFVGRDEIRGWVADNMQGIPDLVVTTESTISEGEHIAWAWVYRGSYTGQYPGLPAGQGQLVELRGVSLLELRNSEIVRETVYFDNHAFLTQVGAIATPPGGATPTTGSVTVRVVACPASSDQAISANATEAEFQAYEADLLAVCDPVDDPAVAPVLATLPDQEPTTPGTQVAPGVYRWTDVPFGDYVLEGGVGEMRTGAESLLVTLAGTGPIQNPVVLLDAATPDAEYTYFYFLTSATPESDSAP
jgi:steroid delta-isomerase-like uncharacterized protein